MTREEFDIGLELLKGEGVTLDLLSGLTKLVDEYIKTLEATIKAQEIIIKDKSDMMEAMAQHKMCDGCAFEGYPNRFNVLNTCKSCYRSSLTDYYEPKAQP